MLNQSVALSVKAVSKNVHAVSVEKCSENGMINIAENLVMCGLAENLSSKRESAPTKGTFLRGMPSRGHCLSSDCLSSSLQPHPHSSSSSSALLWQFSLTQGQGQRCCGSQGRELWNSCKLCPCLVLFDPEQSEKTLCFFEIESSRYPKRVYLTDPSSPKRGPYITDLIFRWECWSVKVQSQLMSGRVLSCGADTQTPATGASWLGCEASGFLTDMT